MQPPPRADEAREELVASFDMPPSFHEFLNAVSTKPGKTSGGITGLTYDHMKAWSKNFKLVVDNNLIKTWKASEAPDMWKWRWLCPIPKNTDDYSLDGQRPIILLVVVRETWLALIMHRVNACWNKYDTLL